MNVKTRNAERARNRSCDISMKQEEKSIEQNRARAIVSLLKDNYKKYLYYCRSIH